MKSALISMLLICTQAMGATIAVIDSGVDVKHKDLVNNLWINSEEISDNGRDEDGNGYQDDVFGWNFAEQNNLVIDRKYIGTFSRDPHRFFEIQGRIFLNRATQEDLEWMQEKRQDPKFLKEMQIFGNFVHGTHVAGITMDQNVDAKILSVKLIPTEVKPFFESLKKQSFQTKGFAPNKDGLRMKLLKAGLKALAGQQMKLLEEISAYVGEHKADIANGSFGTGFNQAKTITDGAFKLAFQREPTQEESNEVARFFLDSLITEGKKMVKSAPDTLFVFAAGNDGMNNDKYPTSPTNIDADNVISVGATYKYSFIAPFSNYGTKTVDVAAPGMLIHSQIPGNEYLQVSGTSQAAPYVANIAAQIKDINPELSPKEIKAIIMGTVDEKSFLQQKIKTKGIVNLSRATYAAKVSLTADISVAIEEARINVADVKTSQTKGMVQSFNKNAVVPIPLTPIFK
jgi:subtilisin family serine protease